MTKQSSIGSIFFKIFLITEMMMVLLYASNIDTFQKASHAFISEGNVFKSESKRLLDNTTQMHNTLLALEKDLSKPHKITQNLQKLDKGLSTIKNILQGVSVIPQIRSDVQKLIQNIDTVSSPVHSSLEKMQQLDKVIKPLLSTTQKAEKANTKILDAEQKFRHGNLLYLQKVIKAESCLHGKFMTTVLTHSKKSYDTVDQHLKQINDDYDTAKNAPYKIMQEVIHEIENLLQINASLHDLVTKLENLYNPLMDVKHLLDKKLSISIPYACGIKTCSKSEPYPCGVKTCSHRIAYGCGVKMCSKHTFLGTTHYPCGTKTCHKNVDYPCGTKTCHKNVDYPCGTKTCHVSISLSIEDILHGTDFIEAKIQSLLSSYVWDALKDVGLESYIKKLQDKANALLEEELKKLHLDIKLNLPHMPTIDVSQLKQLETELNTFIQKIQSLEAKIDLKSLLPQVLYMELKKFYIDIDGKFAECLKGNTDETQNIQKQ